MLGARRRGFDWKEVAEVLHMSRAVAQATFWSEIKRPKAKSVKDQPSGRVSRGKPNSHALKLGGPRAPR
jgi:hypothetical protein